MRWNRSLVLRIILLVSLVLPAGLLSPGSATASLLPETRAVGVTPEAFDEILVAGEVATRTLTLSNSAGSPLTYEIMERSGEYSPLAGGDILLVDDDDNGPNVQSYYTDALDALGIAYDVYDIIAETGSSAGDGPPLATMMQYAAILWFTGDQFSFGTPEAGPNSADEANLGSYLDAGGGFFLSSQDYLYDMGLTAFAQNYLHIGSFDSDNGHTQMTGVAGDPIGDGLGPYTLSYPFTNYSDDVHGDGDPGASEAFIGNEGAVPTAVDYDGGAFRTAFFGWPWEAAANHSAAEGRELLDAILNFLSPPDIPWLSTDPISGTVPAWGTVDVEVTLDSTQVAELGVYQGGLRIKTNDAVNPVVMAPVTLTVLPDLDMGRIQGTVTGDKPGGPLAGATVEVVSGARDVLTMATDANGAYGPRWLPSGSYTVTISHDGYFTDTHSVVVVMQETRVHDVELTADVPEISVTPLVMDEVVTLGASLVRTLTIDNVGSQPLAYTVFERAGGYAPLVNVAGLEGATAPDDAPVVRVLESGDKGLLLDFEIAGLQMAEVREGARTFQQLQLPYSGATTMPGKPQLPTFARYLAAPLGATVVVEVVDAEFEVLDNVLVYPAQEPQTDCTRANSEGAESPDFAFDAAFYAADTVYPGPLATTDGVVSLRGVPMTMVRLYPYQYNPSERQLTAYSHVRVRVTFRGGEAAFADAAHRAASFETLYRRLLLNYEQLGAPPALATGNGIQEGAEFLIITHPDFAGPAQALATWRNQRGISTVLRTTDQTGGTFAEIQAYIKSAYDSWNPAPEFVLFVGDHEWVPTGFSGSTATDLYYFTVDGTDYYPDIHGGRISVDSLAQAEKAINDIIDYDRDPITLESFYERATVAGYFQDDDDDGYSDRRFILTSEDIRDYLLAQDYDVERIYVTESSVDPRFYNNTYYASGEPLPPELLRDNGFPWDGNAADISAAVEAGNFLLSHRDHGYAGGWGEPSYNVGNVLALNNGNLLPVVLSMNCESGRFDGSTDPCFAEAWQRNPNGGAVGVVAATRNSYSGYNDWMAEGIIDAIWPDFLTYNDPGFALPEYRVAAALNYGKIAMTVLWGDPWGEQQLEFELFHWFGDPTMEIHTAPPMGYEVPWLIETPVSGTVAAGDSIEVAITFDAAAVAETGQYTAELLVPSDDPFAALIRIPVTMTVVLDGPVLEITKMASDDPVEAGALLTYTLTVENHGNEDATGVTITDTVPADTEFVSAANGGALVGDAVTWTGLAAPAGDSITVMFTVGVDSPLPNGSVIANDDYAVTCTEGAGDVGPSVEVTVSSAPILAIAKTADPGISVEAGDLLTYTLVVENTGNADATGVTISDAVPADTTFVSADAGGVLVGGDVRWTGKTAPVGDALTVRFTVRVDSPLPNGTLVVNDDYGVTCAQGASTTGAPVEVTVTSSPQLTISKTASHDPVQAGALLTYTITAVNTGNANAGGSVITDVIPVGTTFVAASDGGKLQGDRVEWTDKVVPSGGDLELTFTVRVDSPLPNGTLITNAAYGVTCACGCHAVGAPVEATVESAPVLSIIKTANATYVNPGELLTYTLTVSNTGNANASGVTISDTLPANVVFISADAGGAAADGVVTWDGLAILAGEHISVQLVVEIAMPLPDGAEIVNASYGATCAEGSFAVGSPVIAIVESAPLLAIAVQAWPEMVAAGDFITYTITVSNQGNADATGVDVYDRLPTYTTFISADGGGVLDGDTVKWLGYVVPAGDSLVMHLMVQVDPGMGTGGIVSNDDFGATCAEGGAVQGEAPVDVTVEQTEWFVYLALLLMD